MVNMVQGRRCVGPGRPDKYRQKAILLAVEEEHKVVKLLFGRKDVKPDAADRYGHTPLSCASSIWREKIVKLLVERADVNIDR